MKTLSVLSALKDPSFNGQDGSRFYSLLDDTTALLLRCMEAITHRWPDHFESDISQELYRFAGHLDPAFRAPRPPRYLLKLLCSQYLMRKALNRSLHFFPQKRGLELHLTHTRLQFPFGTKPVLGLVIAISLKEDQERFGERHITTAVQSLLPDTEPVKGSFYTCQSSRDPVRILYLEVGKKDGNRFSLREFKLLKKALPEEMTKRVETLDPAIFNIHREEEVLKNIAFLKRELASTPDLPQSMIFFESQSSDHLSFTILLLRTLKNQTPPLDRCFQGLNVQLVVDRVKMFQDVEASVFCLRLPISPSFVRTDFSINLYRAREVVLFLLEQALGEVRDYNGGLFALQRDLFSAFTALFKNVAKKDPDLLENFYHAITPAHMQAMLSVATLASSFRLFIQASEVKLSKKEDYFFKSHSTPFCVHIMIRTEEASFREHITKVLDEEKILQADSASLSLDYRGSHFLGYIYNSTDKRKRKALRLAIKKGIQSWQDKVASFQSLRLSVQNLPLSLDPRVGGDEISKTILKLMFEGLMRIGKNGKPTYALAEKITISPDGTRYRFILRECYWNNGEQVTAHDFAYAWKKVLSPSFSSAFAQLFYPIKHAREVKIGKIGVEDVGITVIDKRTLQVELEHPCPYFLELTAHSLYSPVNARLDALHPHWPMQDAESYVCNGPFQLKKIHRDRLELSKNYRYWNQQEIHMDQILIAQASVPAACEMAKKGELDWLGRPLRPWSPHFAKTSQQPIETMPGKMVYWFVFNVQRFPFHNLKLRQALALALDKQQLIDSIQYGGKPAFSPLPIEQRQCFQEDQSCKHNLEKARLLFEEALQELQLCKETFPTLTLLYNKTEFGEKTSSAVLSQWRQAFGISIQMEGSAWKDVFRKISEGNFETSLVPWRSSINDPTYTLNSFRYPDEKINFSKWENTNYQLLLQQADYELNPAKRLSFLAQAEHILIQQMPAIPLFDGVDPYNKNQRLVGVIATEAGMIDFSSSYFLKPST